MPRRPRLTSTHFTITAFVVEPPRLLLTVMFCGFVETLSCPLNLPPPLFDNQLGQTLKELNMESRYSLASLPDAMCDITNGKKSWLKLMTCACWLVGSGTRSGAMYLLCVITSSGCAVALRWSSAKSRSCFPKKIHATTLSGFILKISLFLFAYQLDKAFIQ